MFTVILCAALSFALFWAGWRYRALRHDLRSLSQALEQRTPFLSESGGASHREKTWRALVEAANSVTKEILRLTDQRAGQTAQLETTLNSMQEAVLVLDRDNYILLANRALTSVFPHATRALGQRVEATLQSAGFLDSLSKVRTGNPVAKVQVEFPKSAGAVWVELTGTLIPDTTDRNGPWALFVLHDITRQKQLETVRKEFVANVSHELRTPLSVIKGYAETLVDDQSTMNPSDRDRFLRTILRHTQRLSALVEDLLTLSRLESNAAVPSFGTQDLGQCVRGVVDDFAPRYAATGHTLRMVAPADDLKGTADLLKLSQVLSNLLDNAQKHTPSGTHVEVGLRRLDPPDSVEFWVQDDGPGIPREHLSRVFERFYRVDKGRSRETGGTGLGLSIVKHIIHLHGGEIRAESEPGKGTRIIFSIPLSQPSAVFPVVSEE